ncbi:MAG: DUF3240 family protein [Sphingomonas sp.]|nr:DUF3240 family protein [Sphingomonas sp.]
MPDVLLTLYCAGADGALIAGTLRSATGRAVHLREETVFGHDFSDASTAERVTGQLDRRAIDVTLPEESVTSVIGAVERLNRAAPVRWHVTPLVAGGRLP